MSSQEPGPLSLAWDAAVSALGGTSAEDGALEAAYGAADRNYHDTAHVLPVLHDSAELAAVAHEHLYLSPAARDRWEAAARANLTRELASYLG